MERSICFTTEDGTKLAGAHLPGEGPTIVLLHAGIADRRSWGEVATALNQAGADVLAYDRRGFGDTPGTTATFDHVDDLRSVLEQSTAVPAWLVGNSQGGRIALDLALSDPERVAGLVLVAPAVSGEPDTGDDDLDADTRRIDAAVGAAVESGDLDEVARLEAHLWLDGPAAPEGRVSGPARDLALAMNAIALAADSPDEQPPERDTWDHLAEIEAPTTLVWGGHDIPVIIDLARTLAERLPQVRAAIEIPGVAHLPSLEAADAVAALIAAAITAESTPRPASR